MKKILLLVTTLISSTTAIALLPPYYESVREIAAVLADTKVTEAITSGRLIQSIVKTEKGYTITADGCSISLTVSTPQTQEAKNNMVGPAALQIDIAENSCTKK